VLLEQLVIRVKLVLLGQLVRQVQLDRLERPEKPGKLVTRERQDRLEKPAKLGLLDRRV
jgi:hypothetical protein